MRDNLGIVIAIVFAIIMSAFVTLKVLTMSYPNFDLGISYRTMDFFLKYHAVALPSNLNSLTTPKPYSKLIFVLISPTLLIYNSPITVVIDQVLSISVGGYAIFKIFRKITNDERTSFIMEVIYFIYFPLYGFLSNGGNFMVFFGPLFLVSYYFFLTNRKILWVIFSVLSAASNTISPFLVLFVYFIVIPLEKDNKIAKIKSIIQRIRNKEKICNYNIIPYFALLIGLLIFISFLVSIYGSIGLLSGENIKLVNLFLGQGFKTNFFSILKNVTLNDWKIYIHRIYQYMGPFLLIPLSNLFIIPFLLFILMGNYTNQNFFTSPNSHHSSLVIPFIFIGLARTLSKVSRRRRRTIIYLFLILNIIFFAVYSPFGFNEQNWSGSQNAGNVISEVHINNAEILTNSVFALIGPNSSVFLDAHAPQLFDVSDLYFLSSGGKSGAGLATQYNNETVDYVVLYPIPINSFSGQWNMYNRFWSNYFLHNSSYGVYSSIDGDLVLKDGFKGPPIYYLPFEFSNSEASLSGFTNYKNVTNQENFITAGNVLIPPGNFSLTVTFEVPTIYLERNTSMTVTSYRYFVNTEIMAEKISDGLTKVTLHATFGSTEYCHINFFLVLKNISNNDMNIMNVTTVITQSSVYSLF